MAVQLVSDSAGGAATGTWGRITKRENGRDGLITAKGSPCKFQSTATLPLLHAAEEAWMSIKSAAPYCRPVAVQGEPEKSHLGSKR
jgi:hypothetical protein